MALTDCVAARWWLSAAAMICVCGLAEAQDSKSASGAGRGGKSDRRAA